MSDSKAPHQIKPDTQAVQVAAYLWEEYQYRHNLVWQLVFRVTAVATILLIAPFLANQFVKSTVGGRWLLFLPGLAIAVILTGYYVLQCELELLEKIRSAYRAAENQALQHLEPQWQPHEILTQEQGDAKLTLWQRLVRFRSEHFEERVSLFLFMILTAAVTFFFLFLFVWLPKF